MNTLDDLFGEALNREALSTTHERRAAVAEVTIHGARRQRRVRSTVQAFGVVAVVGLGALVSSLVLGKDDLAPAQPTPTPPAPSVTTEPDLDYASAIDERFPQAPVMTTSDWDAVTFAWDAEIVSFVGGGSDVIGSVVAIYLTPPDGDRMLAYATDTTDLGNPTLLGFDASTRSAMLSTSASADAVQTLNLETGVFGEVPLILDELISGFTPLGKISNGDSMFAVTTVDSQSDYTHHVFRMFDGTAVQVTDGRVDLSTVWNDRLVMVMENEFTFLDADGTPPPSIEGADGCFLGPWNTDGSFIAICGATQTRTGDYVRVDPETGEMTTVWDDAEWDSDAEGPESLTALHAVDQVRAWSGVGIGVVPTVAFDPPVLYEDGVKVADLSEGFPEQPDGYGIVFGVRN